MTQFHPLTIKEIRRETPDCVSILFDVPENLKNEYKFEAGQNVTLRLNVGNEDIRRSYSICSSPHENELRIAVKHVEGGRFSSHANTLLQPGHVVHVLPPTGKFSAKSKNGTARNYLAIAAGSGITPVISIIKDVFNASNNSTFTLVYGNRSRNSIIFKEELEGIKNRYMPRFMLHHILSREQTDVEINHGRIDSNKLQSISQYLVDIKSMDQIFLCGPEEMIFTTRDWLLHHGVEKEKIHFELFTVPGENQKVIKATKKRDSGATSHVNLTLDGVTISFDLAYEGLSVLDAALQQGADLPYACKGGVCATCRAKLLKGEVEMDTNYALEDDELKAGFILTCQSHPRTPEVSIDFDVKG